MMLFVEAIENDHLQAAVIAYRFLSRCHEGKYQLRGMFTNSVVSVLCPRSQVRVIVWLRVMMHAMP